MNNFVPFAKHLEENIGPITISMWPEYGNVFVSDIFEERCKEGWL
jgi:hypothetical protein